MMNSNNVFRIIAFGDIHMQTGQLTAIPHLAEAQLVLVTGDLTHFGGKREAEQVINTIRKHNANLFAVPGNLDQPEVDSYLNEQNLNLHGQGRIINNIGIIGVGGSNLTPFKTPNELNEGTIEQLLQKAYQQVQGVDMVFLVSHPPPLNTKADRLDNGIHVGSKAVRSFIEQVQPAFCLTGHIHEARSEDMLGNTKILNPGMFQTGGWIEIMINNNETTGFLKGWS